MTELIEKRVDRKLVTIFVIIFVFFSGVLLSLGNYYSRQNGDVAGTSDNADIIKLQDNYRTDFKQAFSGYLILDTNTDWTSPDLLAKTTAIKNNLLNLKVPADSKDSHLIAIIALTEIEQGIKDKNLDLVLPNVYKLRDVLNNF